MTKIWKHDELQEDLANHIRSAGDKLAWTNIQMGPSGTYRPDVFCVPKSYAHFHPVVYEVKVSLSDFRSDITSGKWQSYLNVSKAVIFAMPAGFINKEDVPAGCGLIIRYESGWKMVKKPTIGVLDTLPRDAWLKLLMSGIEREGERIRSELRGREFNEYMTQRKLAEKFGKELGQLLSDRTSTNNRLLYQIEETKTSIEREKKRRQEAIEAIQKDDAIYTELKKELCAALGLEVGASQWDIRYEISRVVKSLNADAEVKRLNQVIENIQSSVKRATGTEEHFDNFTEAKAA